MEQQLEPFSKRDLYGGAIEFVLPARFVDVSMVREVPDHQEVFADVKTDQSVIVELVNAAEVSDDEAALYHFRDLAEANDAANEATNVSNIERVSQSDLPNFPAGTVCQALLGQQQIAKFNERTNAKNVVNIYLAVVRLPSKGTDILITLNDPIYIAPGSSSSATTPAQVVGREGLTSSATVFRTLLRTLKVNDYSLFDGQEGH